MSDETQNHIEMPVDLAVRDALHEKELAKRGLDTYKELAEYYKTLHREYAADHLRQEGALNWGTSEYQIPSYDKANLRDHKELDTYKELKAEVKQLMSFRDDRNASYQELEARYDKELEDEGLDTYQELAEYYKTLWGVLNDDVFTKKYNFARWEKQTNLKKIDHLNTYEELKRATVYLMKERDHYVELHERYGSEVDELDTYEKLAEHYKDLYKEVHKDDPLIVNYEGKDLKDIENLDTYSELREQTMRLMWAHDNMPPSAGSVRIEKVEEVKNDTGDMPHKDRLGGRYEKVEEVENDTGDPVKDPEVKNDTGDPVNVPLPFLDYFKDVPGVRDALEKYQRNQLEMQKSEIETPPDSDEQVGAAAGAGEIQTPLDLLKDQLRQGGLLVEKDEQEKKAPPVDKPQAEASSATEGVELPSSEAASIVAGDASRLIAGGALPTEDLKDEAFSGKEEGEDAPDAVAAAAPAEASEGVEIEMPLDSVGQVGADAALGAGAVGEAGGPGETVEDAAGKAILDPSGDTGDVVAHMDDPAANAVYDGVENLPFMKDDLEGGLGDVGNEDVVESMDDPVLDS